MFIVMSGWPYSGKTTFVKLLIEQLKSFHIKPIKLDPTEAYPEDITKLPDRTQYAVAAWEVITEEAMRIVSSTDNKTVIILDTTGSNSNVIGPIINQAAIRKHKTMFVRLNTPIEECKSRAGGNWIDQEAEDKYKDRFNSNVNYLETICHSSVLIDNSTSGCIESMQIAARKISKMIRLQAV